MVKSMTGFGRGEHSDGKRRVVCEVKAVNHRYADISIRMPRRYSFAEERVKNVVKVIAKRGKVEVSIVVEHITEDDIDIKLNEMAARQYYENLTELKSRFSLAGEVSLELLASLPDVMKMMPDVAGEEEICSALEAGARLAVENLDIMRVAEGEKLAEDILARGKLIKGLVWKIEALAPEVYTMYYGKLKERIKELTENSITVPEDRIAAEAAIYADKSNITEELVRLKSHVGQLEFTIKKSNQPDGKKLDFLAQEMNREANTIGAKANNLDITNMMLEIKSEIEKIREQIQNIE
ncbi:MAG: YicC family protein [Clostridiales bacterium]|nr:YicC family protein [Clostridiales bacterium]